MKMRFAFPFVLALAVLAAGCGDPAGPDGPGRLVSFSARELGGAPPVPPEVSIFATGGRLEVETEYSSDACARPSARLVNTTGPADEPALLLQVEFRSEGPCPPFLSRYGYRATIEAPPGAYFLHVTHRYVRGVPPEPTTVFASPIAVP